MNRLETIPSLIKAFYGVDEQLLKEVVVTAIPDSLKQHMGKPKPKPCYDNCFHLANKLDCHYVVGFGVSDGFPFQHAWLRDDHKYYDPTLELAGDRCVDGITYYAVHEISAERLINTAIEIDELSGIGVFPPMIETIAHLPKFDGQLMKVAKCFIN